MFSFRDKGMDSTRIVNDNLLSCGYFFIKKIDLIGICAISKHGNFYSVFTNINLPHYSHRYSFPTLNSAYSALYNWTGDGELSGEWLEKHECEILDLEVA